MSGSNNARASQAVIEALVGGTGVPANISQVAIEALVGTEQPIRVSQVIIEALVGTLQPVRLSQAVIEALVGTLQPARLSQVFLEVLVSTKVLPMPSIFPTLAGLTYSVTKRPIGNFGVGEATSGGEVRVNFWTNPMWEWDLTYDYLPDFGGTGGTTSSDIKALMGFYASTGNGFSGFCFSDPDDNTVLGQNIGTGDGTTVNFTLVRTYGLSAYGTTTEPVGYVNTSGPVLNGNTPFNVYLNGTLQSTSSYTVVQTTPVAQYIRFNTAPSSGAVITVDMTFYYWVRFLDPKYDFEKFMNKLWSMKKLTLHSLRY